MFLLYTKMIDSSLSDPNINSSFFNVLLAYVNYIYYWVSSDIFMHVYGISIIFTPFSCYLQLSLTPFSLPNSHPSAFIPFVFFPHDLMIFITAAYKSYP